MTDSTPSFSVGDKVDVYHTGRVGVVVKVTATYVAVRYEGEPESISHRVKFNELKLV